METHPDAGYEVLGQAVLVCDADVVGSSHFYEVVMRIDQSLGAAWLVWGNGQNGETAQDMARREGAAIVSFVRYGLGPAENFPNLKAEACRLRRPGSRDGPDGSKCKSATG
jgi:hypothetical protein